MCVCLMVLAMLFSRAHSHIAHHRNLSMTTPFQLIQISRNATVIRIYAGNFQENRHDCIVAADALLRLSFSFSFLFSFSSFKTLYFSAYLRFPIVGQSSCTKSVAACKFTHRLQLHNKYKIKDEMLCCSCCLCCVQCKHGTRQNMHIAYSHTHTSLVISQFKRGQMN